MGDRLLLVFAGGICSILAWAVWHYLDNDAFSLLSTIALVALAVDNVMLRPQLRSNSAAQDSDT